MHLADLTENDDQLIIEVSKRAIIWPELITYSLVLAPFTVALIISSPHMTVSELKQCFNPPTQCIVPLLFFIMYVLFFIRAVTRVLSLIWGERIVIDRASDKILRNFKVACHLSNLMSVNLTYPPPSSIRGQRSLLPNGFNDVSDLDSSDNAIWPTVWLVFNDNRRYKLLSTLRARSFLSMVASPFAVFEQGRLAEQEATKIARSIAKFANIPIVTGNE